MPESEVQRLLALRRYQKILAAPPEQGYKDIVALAAHICETPFALISLVDEDRQWFKARFGLDVAEAPLQASFCAHAIRQSPDLFQVPDARLDPRFAGNPWVASYPWVRFYAGAPLVTHEGHVLGTLCVIDQVPRQLSDGQIAALQALARQTIAQVESSYQVSALEESELRFRAFMDNTPLLGWLKDEDGHYVFVNRSFLQRCGMQAADILGKTDFDLWPPELACHLREGDLALLAQGEPVSQTEIVPLPYGQPSYWQCSRFVLEGQRRLIGGMGQDVTEAKLNEMKLLQSQEELRQTLARVEVLSITDVLTGLFNRRAFEEKLNEEFERARRYNLPLSLILLDVDHFKDLNDTQGHAAGDALLQAVARILAENARANDVAARYGGDEFVVILPNTDSNVAFHLAERLRAACRELSCANWRVSLSVGVAALGECMLERGELVLAADRALYDAKRHGRNRVSDTY
jgi:diguanylate cyclase (GGDEF)-like protein/PAS domain S-box-containing protein